MAADRELGRLTLTAEEFRAAPEAAFAQALVREVEIITSNGQQITILRKLPPLDGEVTPAAAEQRPSRAAAMLAKQAKRDTHEAKYRKLVAKYGGNRAARRRARAELRRER